MTDCPCGSGIAYAECCEPYIKGEKIAPTAEALMRSRYTAYANTEMDYIFETTHEEQRTDYDGAGAKEWSESSEWHGLEVFEVTAGGENDTEGAVEFMAHFTQNGERLVHHERAIFKKEEDGKWYFFDGQPVAPQTFKRETPKVGRNEPCPCGSGKKYKKCCIGK